MDRDELARILGFPDYASAPASAKAAVDAMAGGPGPGNEPAAAPSPPPADVHRGPPPGGIFTALGEKEAFEAPAKAAVPSGPSGLQLSREDALKLPGAHITDAGNISTRAGPNGSVLEFKPQITGQYLAGTFTGPPGPTGIPGFVEYSGPLGSAPAATKAASTPKAGGSSGSSTARPPAEPGPATGLSRNDVLALSGARERTSASGNKYIEAKAGPNGSSLVFFPNAQGNYDPFFSNRATGKLEEFKGELPKASERAGPQGQGQPQPPSLPPQQRVGSLDPRFASGFQSDKSGVPVFNRADQPGQLTPVPGTLGTINPQFQGQLGERNVGIGINPFAIAAARGEISNHLIVREPTNTPAQQTMGGYGLNDPFEQARLAGLLTGPVSSVGYANRPGEVYVGAGGPLSAVRSSPSSSAVPLAVEERRAAEQLANILGGGYGGFTQAVSPAYQEGAMGGGVDSSIGGDPYMSGFRSGGKIGFAGGGEIDAEDSPMDMTPHPERPPPDFGDGFDFNPFASQFFQGYMNRGSSDNLYDQLRAGPWDQWETAKESQWPAPLSVDQMEKLAYDKLNGMGLSPMLSQMVPPEDVSVQKNNVGAYFNPGNKSIVMDPSMAYSPNALIHENIHGFQQYAGLPYEGLSGATNPQALADWLQVFQQQPPSTGFDTHHPYGATGYFDGGQVPQQVIDYINQRLPFGPPKPYAAGGSLTLNHPATIVDNATGQPLASLAEVRPERMFDRGGSVTIQNHVAGTDRYNYGPTHPYQPPMDPQAVVDAIRARNTRGFGLNPITHAIARAEATGAMHAPGISQMFRFADGGTITQPNPYQSEGTAVPQDGPFGVKKGVGSSVIPGATFGPNPGTSGLPDVSSTPPATPPAVPPATPPTVTSTIDFGPPPATPPATPPTSVPPSTPPATGGFNYSAFPTLPTIGSLPTPPNLNPYLSPQGMDPYTAYLKQLADYQSGLQGQNATFQGQLAQQQLEAEKNVLEQMKGLNALQGQYGAGLEGLRSGANDPLAAEKVAAQQHLRDTYDPYYGKAGMHTPTEIQPPVMVSGQAQLPSLGVGLRYALLDPMQQYKQAVDWYNLQRQPLETAVSLANQYSNVLGNTGSAFSKQVNASIAQAQAQSDVYAKILAQLQAQPGYWNPGLLTPTNPWNNQPNPNPGADPSMGGYNPNATFLGDAF